MQLINKKICMGKDIGIHGNMFGGILMAWIDEAAASFATEPADFNFTCLPPNSLPVIEKLRHAEHAYWRFGQLNLVGGMDRIVAGFERAVSSPIHRNAVVTRIRQTASGAAVEWRDRSSGEMRLNQADYLVVTLPLNILAGIDTNFDPSVKAAIADVPYDYSNKIGFEAPRFWERESQIYGGISFVGGGTRDGDRDRLVRGRSRARARGDDLRPACRRVVLGVVVGHGLGRARDAGRPGPPKPPQPGVPGRARSELLRPAPQKPRIRGFPGGGKGWHLRRGGS